MEISLNANKMPAIPAELPSAGTRVGGAAKEARPAVTISSREFSDIGGSEEVDAAVEEAVSTRDDMLGRLFRQVFSYQPPPMPNFV